MSELSRRLEAAMRAKKHNQKQAAEELGCSSSLLSNLVNNTSPLVEERWPNFAAYLDVGEEEISRLVDAADVERQALSAPRLDLENEVQRLSAAVAQTQTDLTKQRGMIEMIALVLGVEPEPPKAPSPKRRAPSRRAR
jgi:transcriptional regulator with XRE-family HTH domain